MKKAGSKLILLDVNVLLALSWHQHQFYVAAHRRLAVAEVWATCALTQLSLLRLSATPSVIPGASSLTAARDVLARLILHPRHRFLDQLPSPLDGVVFERLQGHRQITDAYLIALARHHGATLVTFDCRMATLAAPAEIEILS